MDDQLIDALVSQRAERQHGVFGTRDLSELAIPDHIRRHRLGSGRWELVHERVYRIVGTPLSWHGHVLAACWAGWHAGGRLAPNRRGAPGTSRRVDRPGRDHLSSLATSS